MNPAEYILSFFPNACADAIAWARVQPDIEIAWKECKHASWMLRCLRKRGVSRRKLIICSEEVEEAALIATHLIINNKTNNTVSNELADIVRKHFPKFPETEG